MEKNHKNILRVAFILALILISVLPNGTSFIPIFFCTLGIIASYFSAKEDLEKNKFSGKAKAALTIGLIILLIILIIIRFRKG